MALAGWNPDNKVAITIEPQSAALTNFPVLINLSTASGYESTDCTAIFTELEREQYKIAVEFGDTGTECFVEIERWDYDTLSAQLWVRVPSISNSVNTVLNFYFDATHADNTTQISTHLDSVVLALPMTGANNSTMFYDLKGKAVTVIGNSKIVTTDSKFGGSSGYFDGSGDCLSIPFSTDFVFTSVSWTIEAWVKLTAWPGTWATVFSAFSNASATGARVLLGPTGEIYAGVSSPNAISAAGVISLNTWHHVAACGNTSDGTVKLFVDGVLVATETTSAGTPTGISNVWVGSTDGINWMLTGYIDDLRVTKNLARYTETFDVPTVSYLDVAAVAVALPMLGANNSTTFTDLVGRAITPTGNVKISSVQSKFDGTSAYFDGNGDYLTIPYSSEIDLNGHAFSIETWVYPTHTASIHDRRLCCSGGGTVGWTSATGIHWLIQFTNGASPTLSFQYWTGSTSGGKTSTAIVALNTWSHIAVCYNPITSTLYLSVNGVVETFTSAIIARPSTSPTINIATIPGESGAADYAFTGYIDDFRIIRGQVLYTSNFDVPEVSVFGYLGAIGQPLAKLVWDSNFLAVYHFSQYAGLGSIKDSTSNNIYLTAYGDPENVNGPIGFGGPVGLALAFDGTNDYLESATNDFSVLQSGFFIEAIIDFLNPVVFTNVLRIGPKSNGSILLSTYNESGHLDNSVWGDYQETAIDIIEGFKYYGKDFNGTTLYSLGGGAYDLTDNTVTIGNLASTVLNIGSGVTTGYYAFQIKSLRISKTSRSAAWMQATAAQDYDQFVTIASVSGEILCSGAIEQGLAEVQATGVISATCYGDFTAFIAEVQATGATLIVCSGDYTAFTAEIFGSQPIDTGSVESPICLIEGTATVHAIITGVIESPLCQIEGAATVHIISTGTFNSPLAQITAETHVEGIGTFTDLIASIEGNAFVGAVNKGHVTPRKETLSGFAYTEALLVRGNVSFKVPVIVGSSLSVLENKGQTSSRIAEVKAYGTTDSVIAGLTSSPKCKVKGQAFITSLAIGTIDCKVPVVKGKLRQDIPAICQYIQKCLTVEAQVQDAPVVYVCSGIYNQKVQVVNSFGFRDSTGLVFFDQRKSEIVGTGSTVASGSLSIQEPRIVIQATGSIELYGSGAYEERVPSVKATREILASHSAYLVSPMGFIRARAFIENTCEGSVHQCITTVRALSGQVTRKVLKYEYDNAYLRAPEESQITDLLSY